MDDQGGAGAMNEDQLTAWYIYQGILLAAGIWVGYWMGVAFGLHPIDG